MKIIQTRNKFSVSQLDNINISNELFVENVGMYWDIDNLHIPVHKFHSYLLIYCKSGKISVKTKKQSENLESGFVKVIPPDTYVDLTYCPEKDNEYYFVHFVGTLAKALIDCIFTDGDTAFIGRRPDIAKYFFDLEKSFEISENDNISRSTLLKNMFYLMLKTKEQKSIKNIQITIAISKVIVYIQNNYNKNITIEQLAKMCCISKNHFMNIFKEHTGRSAIDYIINIRIETAKKLLRNSNYSINEISAEIGFKNSLYFSRIFKNKVGISPNEYKKKVTGEKNGPKTV
ncbi:MAG: AraC family transcriptional regulator [Acutalibacteraceae bacterium]